MMIGMLTFQMLRYEVPSFKGVIYERYGATVYSAVNSKGVTGSPSWLKRLASSGLLDQA